MTVSGITQPVVLVDDDGVEIGISGAPIRTDPTGATTQPVSDGGGSLTIDAVTLPLPTGAATAANQATIIGHVDGIEGLLTTIDADTSVLAATDFATQTTLATLLTEAEFEARVGEVQATPTANTVLGRLKDLYDRFIAQLPAALVAGRLDTNTGAWLGSTAPTVGQKTMVNSVPVTVASNQTPLPVTFTQAGARTGVSGSFLTLGGGTANTLQILRATAYNEPTAAAQRSLSSSSASDTAAGTGARSVRITYYDGAGDGPFTEDVTLNGTTAVNTVATDIRFIEEMDVITVGAGGANVGTITLYTGTGGSGTVIGTIGVGNLVAGVGDNQTFWAHHYVSAGYVAELASLVVGAQSGGSGTAARFFLRYNQPLLANSSEIVVGGAVLVEGAFARSYAFNPKVLGFARISAYAIPVVNNATISLTFDWSEVAV